jgi:hypothetical protein
VSTKSACGVEVGGFVVEKEDTCGALLDVQEGAGGKWVFDESLLNFATWPCSGSPSLVCNPLLVSWPDMFLILATAS